MSQPSSVEVVRKNRYVSEEYLHDYNHKAKITKIEAILEETTLKGNFMELMGHSVEDLDFGAYL